MSQSVVKETQAGWRLTPPCGFDGIYTSVVVASVQTTCWVNKSGCLGRQKWELRRGLIVRIFPFITPKNHRLVSLPLKILVDMLASRNVTV